MAFQQHQPQRNDFVTAETGDAMHMSRCCENPRKRKYTVEGTARETQTRQSEVDAYTSVLRAFRNQTDSISWERESLITNLRQELRLSNDEHLEVLRRISSEKLQESIRELSPACGDQCGVIGASNLRYNIVPHNNPEVSHKQSKKHPALIPHQSFGSSSIFFEQSSLTEGRKYHKVKKHKNVVKVLTNPVQYPSPGPNEMGKTAFNALANKTSELVKHNFMLGKKVKIRVPHDHSFYDAVISRYDPSQGLHALSFNFAPGNDNLQWVDLTKIPPGDIQLDSDDPEMTTLPHCLRPSSRNASAAAKSYHAGAGKGIRIQNSRPKSDLLKVPGGFGHESLEIKIRLTDDLLETVKRVFNAGNVDPYTICDAKEVLKEHEKALIQVLECLADVSDDE